MIKQLICPKKSPKIHKLTSADEGYMYKKCLRKLRLQQLKKSPYHIHISTAKQKVSSISFLQYLHLLTAEERENF